MEIKVVSFAARLLTRTKGAYQMGLPQTKKRRTGCKLGAGTLRCSRRASGEKATAQGGTQEDRYLIKGGGSSVNHRGEANFPRTLGVRYESWKGKDIKCCMCDQKREKGPCASECPRGRRLLHTARGGRRRVSSSRIKKKTACGAADGRLHGRRNLA